MGRASPHPIRVAALTRGCKWITGLAAARARGTVISTTVHRRKL
eukprot:CAMPEP_0115424450 /NCGR_PEP_ID=MMETSP0271-20121206/27848_1 /TAXON_ID=71861 /ORGANISM="Scrippsiella trochoidea, Strain CCMP3099" /LENGTH=43 /DNA_ID= /DNA_START= /DNA_END= /DNA_ORIENTATION=